MFDKISIGIKTFLRDDKLFRAIEGIQVNLPNAKMIIADDGNLTGKKGAIYASLIMAGHHVMMMEYDSGFGRKSNAIADALDRPYLLIGSDDFRFDAKAAEGISQMADTLDIHPHISVAGGRVNERTYEFYLEEQDGIVQEKPIYVPRDSSIWYQECHLTANFCLVRREVFDTIRWDDDVKIGGGEHGAWFIDLMRAGRRVVYVNGVNIMDQRFEDDSELYKSYRNRAKSTARPCFDRRGIRKYICGNGVVDYERAE